MIFFGFSSTNRKSSCRNQVEIRRGNQVLAALPRRPSRRLTNFAKTVSTMVGVSDEQFMGEYTTGCPVRRTHPMLRGGEGAQATGIAN